MKSANGVLILILGILSILMFGCLTGIPAWIMGNNGLKQIDRGEADPGERSLVTAGKILGIVGTALSILGACVWLMVMMGMFGLALSSAGR